MFDWIDPVGDNVCQSPDPDGSFLAPYGDIVGGSATFDPESGEVELIFGLAGSPVDAYHNGLLRSFTLESFIDADQDAQTGPGGLEKLLVIADTGEMSTFYTVWCDVYGPCVTSGFDCSNLSFDPATNRIRAVLPAGFLPGDFDYFDSSSLGGGCFETAPDAYNPFEPDAPRFTSMTGPFVSDGFPETLCVNVSPPDGVAGGGRATLTDGSRAVLNVNTSVREDGTFQGQLRYHDGTVDLASSWDPIGYVAPTTTSRRVMYFGTWNRLDIAQIFLTIHDGGVHGTDTFELEATRLVDGTVHAAEGTMDGGFVIQHP